MMTATTRFETAQGSAYLQRLCKHFAHKAEVEYDAMQGQMTVPFGTARMKADDDGLSFFAASDTTEGLARMKHVIEDHLLRFAFRENPSALSWTETVS